MVRELVAAAREPALPGPDTAEQVPEHDTAFALAPPVPAAVPDSAHQHAKPQASGQALELGRMM